MNRVDFSNLLSNDSSLVLPENKPDEAEELPSIKDFSSSQGDSLEKFLNEYPNLKTISMSPVRFIPSDRVSELALKVGDIRNVIPLFQGSSVFYNSKGDWATFCEQHERSYLELKTEKGFFSFDITSFISDKKEAVYGFTMNLNQDGSVFIQVEFEADGMIFLLKDDGSTSPFFAIPISKYFNACECAIFPVLSAPNTISLFALNHKTKKLEVLVFDAQTGKPVSRRQIFNGNCPIYDKINFFNDGQTAIWHTDEGNVFSSKLIMKDGIAQWTKQELLVHSKDKILGKMALSESLLEETVLVWPSASKQLGFCVVPKDRDVLPQVYQRGEYSILHCHLHPPVFDEKGNMVFVWSTCNNLGEDIVCAVTKSVKGPVSEVIELMRCPIGTHINHVQIKPINNGRFLMVWQNDCDKKGSNIEAGVFTIKNQSLIKQKLSLEDVNAYRPKLIMHDEGSSTVYWKSQNQLQSIDLSF